MRWERNSLRDLKEEHHITILDGKLFIVFDGNFTLLHSPVILQNGAIITTEGFMKMPDGKSRKILEGEYV
jgi:hypothetical protein